MIEINKVSRLFGENKAVDGVSFSIQQGEIIGLLGHNGAGKTTLMKMITGFLEPSAGTIIIDGDVVQGGVTIQQKNIGYLPENLPTYPEMTVIDFLDYAAELRGVSEDQRGEQIRQVIAKTELQDKVYQTIGTLSRGYQQRVGVAQALLNDPKILILDEPTNGLDPSQIQHMRDLITSLKQHATVIISTHILQEVKAMCDRVLILNQGQLALDAAMHDLAKNQLLILKTDGKPNSVENLLKPIQSIESIKLLPADANHSHYEIKVKSDNSREDCIAAISKIIVNNDLSVFGIEPVQFDLETVFRNISEGIDVAITEGGYEDAA